MTDSSPPVLLEELMTVHPPEAVGRPAIASAYRSAVRRAQRSVGWMATESERDGMTMPDAAVLRRLMLGAVSTGHPGVRAVAPPPVEGMASAHREFSPTRSWTIRNVTTVVPDQLRVDEAFATGGLVLDNAERWDPRLADLADSVALALEANVRIGLVVGTVPLTAFGDGDWTRPVVLPTGGSVEVETADSNVIAVPDGHGRRVDSPTLLRAEPGAAVAVIGVRTPTLDDLWASLVHLAGHWPRLRLDLPRRPSDVSSVYGCDGPTSAIDLVTHVVEEELLGPRVAASCLAWWRANLLPASRAVLDPLSDEPSAVIGRLPGGLGFVDDPTTTSALAAAGSWVFSVTSATDDLLGALVEGATVVTGDLSADDRAVARQMLALGLAVPARPDEVSPWS